MLPKQKQSVANFKLTLVEMKAHCRRIVRNMKDMQEHTVLGG